MAELHSYYFNLKAYYSVFKFSLILAFVNYCYMSKWPLRLIQSSKRVYDFNMSHMEVDSSDLSNDVIR